MLRKKLSVESGQYYYVSGDKTSTWDKPQGSEPPLESICPRKLLSFQKDRETQGKIFSEERERRLELINARVKEYVRAKERRTLQQEAISAKLNDDLWLAACQRGKESGTIQLISQELGDISERVFSFQSTYGRKLFRLLLVAHGLEILDSFGIPDKCKDLVVLSLASNKISCIPENICNLTQLTRLDLTNNKVDALPQTIGKLISLEILQIGNNLLSSLPSSIGKLSLLKKLDVECNLLNFLPRSLGEAASLEKLCCTSNRLLELPTTLADLPHLKSLLVSNNQLKHLPGNIGLSKSLRLVHASKNILMELPESICSLQSLTTLRLDYNRITALPQKFHELIYLEELRLEGNFGMVMPTMDTIICGLSDVMKWSKMRFQGNSRKRKLNIILNVQDVLKQVVKRKVAGYHGEKHDSLVREHIDSEGFQWYQFTADALWGHFLPALKKIWSDDKIDKRGDMRSFPFYKAEVEEALLTFDDAGGRVAVFLNHGRYRRCSCKDRDGKKFVCVPPEAGWMCERPSWLMRKTLMLEQHLTEKRRQDNESAAIQRALEASETASLLYLKSEEGVTFIQACAFSIVDHLRTLYSLGYFGRTPKEDGNLPTDIEIDMANYGSDAVALKVIYTSEIGKILQGIEETSSKSEAFDLIFRVTKMDFSAGITQEILRLVEVYLQRHYVDFQIQRSKKVAHETNTKMRKIMKSWMGLGLEDAFLQWKIWVKHQIERRKRDAIVRQQQMQLEFEDKQAQLAYAHDEVAKWCKRWDEFNDRYYWTHIMTGEETWEQPMLVHYLPNGW
eukprot:CAMPEP_0116031780 /NCGR_PEP_ID=MMETSP0321-20121206/17760_1 /TAXON_ID=163516 /ORGANISM="Leptocylindrus danicus var. danicus, Strain B650" /LENGTH=791 /DNA_ID=CAMNT_0003507055 /DNA_START=267 /DNA_END=2639 /DNA_ORIENTATION=-